MPRRQYLELECDFCGFKESFNPEDPKAGFKLKKWNAVANALAPNDGKDDAKWYDSADCIAADMKRHKEAQEVESKFESQTA